jgi:hypothetical protein
VASGQLRDSFWQLPGSFLPTGASVICRFERSNSSPVMAAHHMGVVGGQLLGGFRAASGQLLVASGSFCAASCRQVHMSSVISNVQIRAR